MMGLAAMPKGFYNYLGTDPKDPLDYFFFFHLLKSGK